MILVYRDLLLPRRGRPLLGLRLVLSISRHLRLVLHPAPAQRRCWCCRSIVWWPQHLVLCKQKEHLACSCAKQLLMQQHLRFLNRFYLRLHLRFLRLLR